MDRKKLLKLPDNMEFVFLIVTVVMVIVGIYL